MNELHIHGLSFYFPVAIHIFLDKLLLHGMPLFLISVSISFCGEKEDGLIYLLHLQNHT